MDSYVGEKEVYYLARSKDDQYQGLIEELAHFNTRTNNITWVKDKSSATQFEEEYKATSLKSLQESMNTLSGAGYKYAVLKQLESVEVLD